MARRSSNAAGGPGSGEGGADSIAWTGSNLGADDTPQCERFSSDYFGVVTATLTRRRRERNLPSSADWLDVKGAPNFFNLPCMGIERVWQDAWALYRYGYEGIIKELGAAQNITFELDLSLTEEPIKTHPDFANLRKKYLWNINTQRFPEIIAGTGKDKGKVVRNPMAGVEAYLSPGAIFRKTTVSNTIPGSIYNKMAQADDIPSVAGFPMPDIGSRQWFKLAPKVRKRGNCVEIVEEWMLSGPYGINQDVYNHKAMWEMAGGKSNSGGVAASGPLQSGSL